MFCFVAMATQIRPIQYPPNPVMVLPLKAKGAHLKRTKRPEDAPTALLI